MQIIANNLKTQNAPCENLQLLKNIFFVASSGFLKMF